MRHDLVWGSVLAGLLITGCGGGTGSGDDPGSGGAGSGGTTGSGDPGSGCAVTADVVVGGAQGTVPDIVWGGDWFTVVWQDLDNDGGDIQLAMFDTSGKLITQQAIATGPATSGLPSVGVTPNGYLVLWEDTSGAGSVVQARYAGTDGTPSGNAATLATSSSPSARPDAATSAAGTAVVWEASTTAATLAALNGVALGAETPMNPGTVPAVLGSGAAMGAVWSDAAATNQHLLFSPLASPGGPVHPVSFRGEAGTANVPRLAYDGSAFWVAWEDTRAGVGNENIYLVRIAGGQAGSEISVPSASGSANYPDVVSTGAGAAVVYYQFRDGASQIFLTRIGAGATPIGPDLQVSSSTVDAKYPRVAWSGKELGVVYAEKGGSARLALVTCN